MKKVLKIIQILLVISIFLTYIINLNNVYASSTVASGTCGDNITWTLDTDGKLTITGSGKMSGDSCAWVDYKDQVKEVEFTGNITSISECAFEYNTNLEKVTLPNTLTNIGRRAFAECVNLKSITFPKSLRTVGVSSFYKCTSLEEVDLPEDLLYLYDNAFADCQSLKTITIRSSTVLVGDEETTISNTATICGYKYSGAFYYARYYGRSFKDLSTNEITTYTIDNQSFLDALPTENLEALGITSHNSRSYSGNILNGYHPEFCNEKDEENETYKEIKAKVEELTKNCTTDREKAYEIFRWAFINIDYQAAYGASANIDRIYSIFNEKLGSCEAYTMMTNYMLYLCGIPTATVSNLTHEWTAAYVDGEWMYIDSTQNRFGNTPNKINQISFAYDGLIYVIDDPQEGAKVTGIAMTDEELEDLTSFTIPTNSYMKGIYETAFDRDLELRAEEGTVGAEFIKNNRIYQYTEGNQVIGSNTEIQKYLKGDINQDGIVNAVDVSYGMRGIIHKITLTDLEEEIGDVNGDGIFNVVDINNIMRYILGKIEEL